MKYILAIAIEEYKDPLLRRVRFALDDAKAFIKAWEQYGFTKPHQFLHLNDDASKTAIEARLRRIQRALTENDELIVYYAGHGFSVGGVNVLTAWDSQYGDLEHTTIRLANILETLRKSECTKVKLFLDACHTGVEMDPSMRGVDATMSDEELRKFFEGSDHYVAFAACHDDEKSYSSGTLKHGIWTYHLLEALNGTALLALEKGRLLTSNSLQNYLRKEVPRTVRQTVIGGPSQNPWMFGGAAGEFLVADLTPILAARAVKAQPADRHLPRISFYGDNSIFVKRLSGWKPTHRVPKVVDGYAQSFVEKIGQGDVEQDIDATYKKIRDIGYKRRDMRKSYTGESGATIITPDFDYNVTIQQDPDDPEQAILRREVTHIQNPQVVMSDEFQHAFAGVFDTIEFDAPSRIKVLDWIDLLEDVKPEGIELVDYDDEGTFCEMRLDGIEGSIKMTPSSILVVADGRVTPRELAKLFGNTWNKLLPAAPKGLLPEQEDKGKK
ncbi:MAG: caspase family protein [Phycisphaerae bacterium]|nr:caspase family protein [Phycisphaerae bacterium]